MGKLLCTMKGSKFELKLRLDRSANPNNAKQRRGRLQLSLCQADRHLLFLRDMRLHSTLESAPPCRGTSGIKSLPNCLSIGRLSASRRRPTHRISRFVPIPRMLDTSVDWYESFSMHKVENVSGIHGQQVRSKALTVRGAAWVVV